MLVVQVDVLDAQPVQRRVAGRADILRAAVDRPAAVRPPLVPELGGQHHLVPAALDGPADQPLVGEGAVRVGRVEESHAQVEGAVDGGHRLLVIPRAVGLAHAHAAQTQFGHVHALAQRALFHQLPFRGEPCGPVVARGTSW